MKFAILALPLMFSASVMADSGLSTQKASGYALSGTVSPFMMSATSSGRCLYGKDINEGNVDGAQRIASCVYLGLSVTSSTVLVLKEEVQHIEPDAYAFLAGDEMTLALAEVVAKAQEEVPELQEESAEAIVTFLISI